MKRTLLAFIAISTIVIVGCVSRNPNYPATSDQPYQVDPKLAAAKEKVQGVVDATAPFNPYAPLTGNANAAIFGVLTLISAEIARRKNNEAKRQRAAADSLAETVVKTSQSTAALQTAGANGVVDIVAQHIDNNTSV